ncbi:MAG: dienelactone hydrolase family protein [Deltaproteobacteria bacterium]|nr:dienelactone hydrolase family protein [Deltaproteobacteria bacterium]
MTQTVKFPSSIGESSGAFAAPAGVVVVQEWWGVNDQIKSLVKRWADAGFLAIAPDLYHGKVVPIGQSDEAQQAMSSLDFGKAVQEIAGAVELLRARGCEKIAVTGYCMGGALSLAAAVNVRGLACVVPYYGLPGDLDWSKVDAPVQAHFATKDEWATVAGAEEIKAAVTVPMELHVYEAQHAFCNDRRPEVYDAEAANLSWERTLAFVRKHTHTA